MLNYSLLKWKKVKLHHKWATRGASLSLKWFALTCSFWGGRGWYRDQRAIFASQCSFYHVGSGDWTWAARLGSKCPYPLRHLAPWLLWIAAHSVAWPSLHPLAILFQSFRCWDLRPPPPYSVTANVSSTVTDWHAPKSLSPSHRTSRGQHFFLQGFCYCLLLIFPGTSFLSPFRG